MSEVDDIPIKLRIGEVVNVTCRTQELILEFYIRQIRVMGCNMAKAYVSYSPYHMAHMISDRHRVARYLETIISITEIKKAFFVVSI